MKWISPAGHKYRQLNNNGKLVLFNWKEMKVFDSERHALDQGWKKIDLANDKMKV